MSERVFFGKISATQNIEKNKEQIELKRYYANKDEKRNLCDWI